MRAICGFFLVSLAVVGCSDSVHALKERCTAQVNRLADDLDRRTDPSGVYQRIAVDEVRETDPWGKTLEVRYSKGGVAEIVVVTSAGPDGALHTSDDISTQRMSANFSGLREGLKKDAHDIAKETAKGAVRGGLEGLKESVKDTFKKKE